jgi:hypothetical protein
MGYYNYQKGLIYRNLGQEGGWDNHLERCRSFILKAIEFYKPSRLTVIGSGWLLEVPLAEMVEKCAKINLVDIIHPPDVVSQSADLLNVELIEQDVTGGLIEEVYKKSGKFSLFRKLRTLESIIVPEYKPAFDPGMVISMNILTQLESLLIDFLKKRSKIKENEYSRLRSDIQKKHIDFLMKYNSVIVTDYAEVITNMSGSIKTIPTLMADLPPGKFREEWTWNFDQTGADLYNSRSLFKVVAIIL